MRTALSSWPAGTRLARGLLGVALAISCVASPRTASSAEIDSLSTLAGAWEIGLHDTERKCGMVLRTDKADDSDYVIAMPAGCRRAMPVLMTVGGWTFTADRVLELEDKSGKPVLDFTLGDNNSLLANGPQGEIYELVATGRQKYAQAFTSPQATAPAATEVLSATTGVRAPSRAPLAVGGTAAPANSSATSPMARYNGRVADLAGRYVILRTGAGGGKDVGCMLTLDDKARGPKGDFKAQLAPACRDNGIVVFDPVGWKMDRAGGLALTARKGHEAHFEYHVDGAWWKDPKEGGVELGLRHM